MDYITPIDSELQKEVLAETRHYIDMGERLYARAFEDISVTFDLKGRSSGMYRVKRQSKKADVVREIRYNPWIFAAHYEHSLAVTVPHEVAHYLADSLFGRSIRPHGREWRGIMADFDVDASTTASLSLEGIPQRKSKTYFYQCACGTHKLGVIRHNRVLKGVQQYRCKQCLDLLKVC